MTHRNRLMLLLAGAIFLGWVGIVMVVQGNDRHPNVLPQPQVLKQPETPPKSSIIWEYRTICVQGPFENAAQTLNEFGKKGWEVVVWKDGKFSQYLLKRQIAK